VSAGFDEAALRALVRQALLEAMPASTSPETGLAGRGGPATGQTLPAPAAPAPRPVRITDDHELAAFVRDLVHLADDPVQGAALRAGWLRFTLAGGFGPQPQPRSQPPAPVVAAAPARVVVAGPVLERHVRAAAENGSTLVAASRGLVTPLARELARSRGVTIVVEPTTRRRDR
jgi:hypothetical protein